MSYEGRVQHFCSNGHFWVGPEGYCFSEPVTKCYSCGANSVLQVQVDDTNGYEHGIIPIEQLKKLLLAPQEVETCNLGHQHVTKEATYRLPTKEELEELRHYRDWQSGKLKPLSSLK